VVPERFRCDRITAEPVRWSGGQTAASADAVLWAIGRVTPNTDWLPADLLDEHGFVRVTPELRVPGYPGVFAVGDVAATDPLRCSARNRGDALVARNVRAELDGKPLCRFKPLARRWGSVLGVLPDGLEVFTPGGRVVRIPLWAVNRILQPVVDRRLLHHGVRDA
jgi:apoptosis-inducing factor 2